MTPELLISPAVPILTPEDSGESALSHMHKSRLTQLPLIAGNKYLALVQEQDLLYRNLPESPLTPADFSGYRPAVFTDSHPYEILRLAHHQRLSVVPVVDQDSTYLGAITIEGLLQFLLESTGADKPGGIIVLEVLPADYSLSAIIRICEQEDTMIISTSLSTVSGTLTLKTDRTDLFDLATAFERHGYTVRQLFGANVPLDNLQDRYELLMTYINM